MDSFFTEKIIHAFEVFYYAIFFLVSFCLTYIYFKWAIKLSVLDLPNERSSHITPTPLGGGIAFIITFYSGLLLAFLNKQIEKDLFLALLPGLGLAVVGAIDDIIDLAPLIRFSAQVICSGIALFFLHGLNSLFGDDLILLWSLLGLVGMVWFINLYNFLDGSDGYASMEAIIIASGLWFFTRMDVFLILIFSVGGFLFWNWPKARIFMGDAGSTTLGFILIVFGIYFHNNGSFHFVFWLILTALFWFDATITLLRRIMNREKLSQAHKKHMYQRAIRGGFSHLTTLISGFGINILLFLICVMIWKKYIPLIFGLIMTILILGASMIYIERKFNFKKNS